MITAAQIADNLKVLVGLPSADLDQLNDLTVAGISSAQIAKLSATSLVLLTQGQAKEFSSEVEEWAYSKGYTTIADSVGTSVVAGGIDVDTTIAAPTAGLAVITAGKSAVTVTGSTGADTIVGSTGADTISTGADSITAGEGNDIITVTSGETHTNLAAMTIAGGDGTDKLVIGAATTTLVDSDFAHVTGIETLALTGITTVVLGSNATTSGIATVITGSGDTSISSASDITVDASGIGANDLTLLGAGDVTATVGATTTSVVATSLTGALTLSAGGAALATITGGDGADTLVSGTAVASTITGGAGVDTMTGGSAADKYSFTVTDADTTTATATDVITNFVSGTDKLLLGAAGAAAVTGVAEVFTATLATIANTETVIFGGITYTAAGGDGSTAAAAATAFDAHADWVVTSSGQTLTFTAAATGTKTDTITGDFTGTGNTNAPVSAVSVTTQGVAAVAGTYLESETAVADIATLLTAADTALDGTVDFYFGVVGSNGYVVQDDNGTGHTNLIQLTGVTSLAATDIIATA